MHDIGKLLILQQHTASYEKLIFRGMADGLESINAEFDQGQFELTLRYDDALKAADDAFLFRVLAREAALEQGLRMTFLGKPFVDFEGNGVHVNYSFLDSHGNNALCIIH